MFLCDNCQIRSICKIFESISPYKDIIALSECGAKNLINHQFVVQNAPPEPVMDMQEKIDAIKELTNTQDEEDDYIRKSEDNICEDCKKTDTDLLICSECNKHICPDCATEDFDGNVYCQECYDKKDGVSL